MYIKKIIIDGFKSYKHKTVLELDPRHNVVVGENGSGKSTILSAIEFVLSREFIPLKKKQQRELLNERSGPSSVEIIFDNSDKRLPIDKECVSVKRTIFVKTDEFLFDDKKISAKDILGILNDAGFSESNLHYIVKQGKITEFASKSEMRLQLLYEIASTKFYTDYKKDMIAKLHAIERKKIIIESLLIKIAEKENSLKEEKKRLKEYENLCKTQKVIQLVIENKTIQDNSNNLKTLENEINALTECHTNLTTELLVIQENINIITNELKKFKQQDRCIQDEKKIHNLEKEKLLKEKNQLSIRIADLQEDKKHNSKICQEIYEKFQELDNLINEKEKSLEKIQSQYNEKLKDEEAIKTKLDLKEQNRDEIYRKQGRGSQFKNKEERDLWINQELQCLKKQIADKTNDRLNIEQEIKKDKKEYNDLERKIELETKVLIDQEKKLKDFRTEFHNLKRKKDEFVTLKMQLFKDDKNYTDKSKCLTDEIAKLEQTLNSIFGRSIRDGINSVQKVLEIFKNNENMREELTKFCGHVIENFTCKPELFKAVEETAGAKLFYPIVETRAFGHEIIKEMNRNMLPGNVTFLALDCLEVPVLHYPRNNDSVPLISQLQYESKFEKPISKIFGRSLVCRDLEVAKECAKKYHFDCVTVLGDKVTAKGWMRGGHFREQYSPIKIQEEIYDKSNDIVLLKNKLKSIRDEIKENQSYISKCISSQQNIEVEIEKASKTIIEIKSKINFMNKELNLKKTSFITKQNNLKEYERQLSAMFALQKSLSDELCQNVEEILSIHDEQQIENLNDSINQLKKKLGKIFKEREKLEDERKQLEIELNTKLIFEKNELIEKKEKMSLENIQESLDLLQDEFKRKENELLKREDSLKIQDEKANELFGQIKEKTLKRDELQLHNEKLLQDKAEIAKRLEKITSKIHEVKKTIQRSSIKTSELRIDENIKKKLYATFNKMSHKDLMKKLQETTDQLNAHDPGNKKVLDQFQEFANQRQLLKKTKEETDIAFIKIQELINVLEAKTSEAIQFTFNQISENFNDIFKRLVPTGNAYLKMQTVADANCENDTETTTEPPENYDDFTGIDIMASFSQSAETKEIHRLSGGQKSLVSLAFIFALQKCNPAPLYLLDEIDHALDSEHRKAVIKMILDCSRTAQFITITLRPEFIQDAHKHFCVTFQNDTSHVETITREEALLFLTG